MVVVVVLDEVGVVLWLWDVVVVLVVVVVFVYVRSRLRRVDFIEAPLTRVPKLSVMARFFEFRSFDVMRFFFTKRRLFVMGTKSVTSRNQLPLSARNLRSGHP